jgi:hypothetical protein
VFDILKKRLVAAILNDQVDAGECLYVVIEFKNALML